MRISRVEGRGEHGDRDSVFPETTDIFEGRGEKEEEEEEDTQ